MPKVSNQPKLGELRHLVWICTTTERPDNFVSTVVDRPGVFRTRARIRDIRQARILDYKAVMGDENAPTKEVTIRCPCDTKIDLGHWVYWEDCISKMWMKVRGVQDLDELHRFVVMQCSVDVLDDIRSDPATQQPPPAWTTPDF